MKTITDVVAPKLEALELQKSTILKYAIGELEEGDYHAVQDAASDLRDIDAKIEVLKLVLGEME